MFHAEACIRRDKALSFDLGASAWSADRFLIVMRIVATRVIVAFLLILLCNADAGANNDVFRRADR